MRLRTWLDRNRRLVLAIALWLAGIVAFAIALTFLPEGVCDYGNHDAFVAAENRGGPFLLASAAFVAGGAVALLVDAVRTRGLHRVIAAVAGVTSLAVGGVLALVALATLIHFSCLD